MKLESCEYSKRRGPVQATSEATRSSMASKLLPLAGGVSSNDREGAREYLNCYKPPECSRSSRGYKRSTLLSMATISSSEMLGPVGLENARPLRLTYLEGNSWLWDVSGVQILIDPVLVGNLDFGIPWLYDGAKKFLKKFKLEDLPRIDYLLITQSLDDHCHQRTLQSLSKMIPSLPVISTPNAEPVLSKLFNKVTYLEPGSSTVVKSDNGTSLKLTASAGPVLGPPWQRPENGYFIETANISVYYEPHCIFDQRTFENRNVDVLVTPVIKQRLPFLTLVSGQEDAVKLAMLLQPK